MTDLEHTSKIASCSKFHTMRINPDYLGNYFCTIALFFCGFYALFSMLPPLEQYVACFRPLPDRANCRKDLTFLD